MINTWLQWLLNIPSKTFNWLFTFNVMPGISFGSIILYFFLVYIAIKFMTKMFWE